MIYYETDFGGDFLLFIQDGENDYLTTWFVLTTYASSAAAGVYTDINEFHNPTWIQYYTVIKTEKYFISL